MFYVKAIFGYVIFFVSIGLGAVLGVQSPVADDQSIGWIAIFAGLAGIILLTWWLIRRRSKAKVDSDLVTTSVDGLDFEARDAGGDETFLSLGPTGDEDPGLKGFGADHAPLMPGENRRIQVAMADTIINREGLLFEVIQDMIALATKNLEARLQIMHEAHLMRDDSELTYQAAMDAAAKSLDPTALPEKVKMELIQASGGALAAWLEGWKGERPLMLVDLPRNVVMPLCMGELIDEKLRKRLGAGADALGESWQNLPYEVLLAFQAMYQLRLAEGEEVWENILSLKAHEWSAETLFRTLEGAEKEALMGRLEEGDKLEGLSPDDIDLIEELLESTMAPAAPVAVAQAETDPVLEAVIMGLRNMPPAIKAYGIALATGTKPTVSTVHKPALRRNLRIVLSDFDLTHEKAVEVCGWLSLDETRTFPELFAEDQAAPTPPAPGAEGGDDEFPGQFDLPEVDAPERDIVAVMAKSLREIGQTGLGDRVGNGDECVNIPGPLRGHFSERLAREIGDQPLTSDEIQKVKAVIADAESFLGDLLKRSPSDIRHVLEQARKRVRRDVDGGQ